MSRSRGDASRRLQRPVVVAMVAVRVVQVAVDQIVDVITVGHGLVTATRAMLVRCVMAAAFVGRCAS